MSGGFDPLHMGHIELFNRARSLSDALLVFLSAEERRIIVENIKSVDLVIPSIDKDETVCATLEKIATLQEAIDSELYFCNGGDRKSGEDTPEHKICEELGIHTIYGLGDKIQSSSWLTK